MNAPMGRPPRDLVKLAEDLISWSESEDASTLNRFCGLHRIPPSVLSSYAKKDIEFSLAFEQAKANIAVKREQMAATGGLSNQAYAINARVYDYYADEKNKQDLDEAAERTKSLDTHKSKLNQNLNNDFQDQFRTGLDGVLKDIRQLQKDHSKTKNA
jgi:hypothetical protein